MSTAAPAQPATASTRFYLSGMRDAWEDLARKSHGGTILHSRRFLEYHGSRFAELSCVLIAPGDESITGIFPIVAHPARPHVAVSHAGSSFGGALTLSPDPIAKWQFFRGAAKLLLSAGYHTLIYSAAPSALLRQPDDGLLPVLLKCGHIVRCDLWSVLGLRQNGSPRKYWTYEIARGARKGLTARPVENPAEWSLLHGILAEHLARKYGVRPVHTPEELADLHFRLGAASHGLLVCDPHARTVAGMWCIDYGNGTLHLQYNAATQEGLKLRASSFGVSRLLEFAIAGGFEKFSFGRSTESDGWSLNRGLLRFKAQFGAGLGAQFHLEIDLTGCLALSDDYQFASAS
jgi:hypothetical protein